MHRFLFALVTALVLIDEVPVLAVQYAQVTTNPAEDISPCWSPDGSEIAFISDRSGNKDVWVIAATGEVATQITVYSGSDTYRPSWSPDGSKIAFTSIRSGKWEIWTIPAMAEAL